MTGTLAQTIQGEAGSNPANQFAVASTIFNRMRAGNFPGGADPNAIVNAPQQFVGFAATPNASANQFAAAIQNGTLSNYGSTGNAVNFQSGQTAANNGFTNGGANIGGNWFSDRFGSPTSNFVAPAYGQGSGTTLASGPTDTSGTGDNSGVTPDSNPLGSSVTQSGGASPSTPGSQPGTIEGQTQQPVSVGIQPGLWSDITTEVNKVTTAAGQGVQAAISAAETAVGTWFGGVQNWFIRAGLILLGVILVAIALMVMMWDHGGEKFANQAAAMARA